MPELLSAVASLPAQLQAILTAYYLDGLTERQAARLLGISRQRCRIYHQEALSILRGDLNVRES